MIERALWAKCALGNADFALRRQSDDTHPKPVSGNALRDIDRVDLPPAMTPPFP